ncbi:hypothetical protein BHU72_14990 [Desulfuribacillus stibiiarsenatis]|uniref:Restriction endonuclease type IV Mrr domain-containing protein n=2 Tax=Desulfuribacillus stibiiarsenatis TaxID=1390249 RepID=A0A1E5L771_9FIRM|nr:hypothetical protein BHU72_14990 [Desulfuribacillus stibiiarsenatis]
MIILKSHRDERRRKRIVRDAHIAKLKSMHPLEFEHYIADIFRLKGYTATVTPPTGDAGKDVILIKGSDIRLVECKRYNSPKVTRPDIQKFHSAIIDSNASCGYFITTGYFTKPAIEYVSDKPIHLIDLPSLLNLIEQTITENEMTKKVNKIQLT